MSATIPRERAADAPTRRVPRLELHGTLEERAWQQGLVLRAELPATFEALRQLPVAPRWLPRGLHRGLLRAGLCVLGRSYLRWHGPLLREHAEGRWSRALAAMAGAARLSPGALYAFSSLELEGSTFGFQLGCSSLALGGRRTTRLAYNHDFPPSFGPQLVVRRSRASDAFDTLSLSYPALPGAVAGVNEAGLALSLNSAYATDVRRRRAGWFLTLLLQECLERCADVDAALETLERAPVANGGILTLVDRRGARAAVECSTTRKCVRRPREEEPLWSINRYRASGMEAVEVPLGARSTGLFGGVDIHAHNVSRGRRFEELLGSAPPADDEAILALFSDHDGGEGDARTICRHRDPLSETLASVLIDPTDRSMLVAGGNPCAGGFRRETL